MKKKVFEIINNNIEIYIKIPRFVNFMKYYKKIDEKYKKINKVEFEKYLGWKLDITGKYLILIFVLRDIKNKKQLIEENYNHIQE